MEFNQRKLVFIITGIGILLVSLLFESLPVTGQNPNTRLVWAVEQETKTEHHAEEHATEEHHGAPFIYYVDWLLLIIALSLVLFKVRGSYKKLAEEVEEHHVEEQHPEEQHPEEHHATPTGRVVPVVLILLVAFIFLTESLSAVAHYHEPVGTGLIHLLIKLATGVLLMFYGLTFMHEH